MKTIMPKNDKNVPSSVCKVHCAANEGQWTATRRTVHQRASSMCFCVFCALKNCVFVFFDSKGKSRHDWQGALRTEEPLSEATRYGTVHHSKGKSLPTRLAHQSASSEATRYGTVHQRANVAARKNEPTRLAKCTAHLKVPQLLSSEATRYGTVHQRPCTNSPADGATAGRDDPVGLARNPVVDVLQDVFRDLHDGRAHELRPLLHLPHVQGRARLADRQTSANRCTPKEHRLKRHQVQHFRAQEAKGLQMVLSTHVVPGDLLSVLRATPRTSD